MARLGKGRTLFFLGRGRGAGSGSGSGSGAERTEVAARLRKGRALFFGGGEGGRFGFGFGRARYGYRSISFENLIHEYLLELMIHEYLLKLHLIHNLPLEFFKFPTFQELLYISFSQFTFLCLVFGAMSYNFYFISGRNPASTIQALQQTPKAQPEPRPRPVLQLVDQLSPEIAPLTEANVQGTTPAPRPRNRDILRQRAESIRAETIRDDASIRAPSTRRSRSHRSRSPGRQSTQVTGQIDFHPSPPNIEAPPGQWNQNTQGVWNQYGESSHPLPPAVNDPQLWRPPAVAVPQPRPPGFPYCTFAPRQNPLAGQSPPVVPVAPRPFSVFPPFSGTQTVPRPIASPPSGDPVIPVENLIDTSVSLNVTPNQTEFRAWINGRVYPSFGMKDTMVHYISRLLDVAKYNVADLQDLKTSQVWPKRPWTRSRGQTTIVLLSVTNPRIQASSQDSRPPPSSSTKSKSSIESWSYWARYDFPHIKPRRS